MGEAVLKQLYVRSMQTIGSLPLVNALYYTPPQRPAADDPAFKTWLASLGAIYHLDRMVALDIPWWNVEATRAVADWLKARPGARVFEYGSGASSIWLARRAAMLITVEHDPQWAPNVARHLAGFDHAELIVTDPDPASGLPRADYVGAIAGFDPFDLIIVDGRRRNACLAAAVQHLRPGGMVLFDDSGRTRYREAIARCGLTEQRFHGRSYCVPYPDHTSLLTQPAGAA